MGCGGSKSVEDQQSKQVEKTLASAQREDAKTVKLLLLGAGESGKTTFLKQLKARFSAPPTARELSEVADIIRGNILEFMANLATAMVDLELDGDLQDELQPTVSKLTSMNTKDTAELTPVFARNLLALWLSAPAQAVFARRAEFQLVESHTVFIERAVEIADPRFEADFQDMLKARVKTSGIKSENLVIDGVNFEIFDVGGQKSERRKWIRCFDNVTAIVFFVGISEYDQMMHEDETTNRMEDAIGLFHETVTNEAFEKTSVCVFLNKVDLFENKLKTVPISSVPLWSGDYQAFAEKESQSIPAPSELDLGIGFFMTKFQEAAGGRSNVLFKPSTATDTSNILAVWEFARRAILLRALQANFGITDASGLMGQ